MTHEHRQTHTHTHTRAHMHMHRHTHKCAKTHTCAHTHTHTHTHMHTHLPTHTWHAHVYNTHMAHDMHRHIHIQIISIIILWVEVICYQCVINDWRTVLMTLFMAVIHVYQSSGVCLVQRDDLICGTGICHNTRR